MGIQSPSFLLPTPPKDTCRYHMLSPSCQTEAYSQIQCTHRPIFFSTHHQHSPEDSTRLSETLAGAGKGPTHSKNPLHPYQVLEITSAFKTHRAESHCTRQENCVMIQLQCMKHLVSLQADGPRVTATSPSPTLLYATSTLTLMQTYLHS